MTTLVRRWADAFRADVLRGERPPLVGDVRLLIVIGPGEEQDALEAYGIPEDEMTLSEKVEAGLTEPYVPDYMQEAD